jgi:shikimate kinase
MKYPVFLIGYMACGKTTFGKALSRRLNCEFIDLDFYIEQRFRKHISDIFAEKGEVGFRRVEREMLCEVGEFENVVIACGGGTPCFYDNMDYMLERGTVVWLTASIERIVDRLVINNSRRPLMAGKSRYEIEKTVKEGLASRHQFYSRAGIHFSGEQLEDKRQIEKTVEKFLSEMGI